MKKFVAVILMVFSATALMASGGSPIVGGGTGILTVPTANTMGKGVIDLGFYFITPETMAFSVGFGLIERLDLSVGFEMDSKDDVHDPFLHFRAKYRFAGNGKDDSWALGADLTMSMDDQTDDDLEFSIYIVNSYWASSLGMRFTWGAGYTFNSEDNFNVMIGVSKKIVTNLYLEMDFSNFPNRYYANGRHLNTNRGIGNIAVRFHLFDGKLRLTAGCFDAFDASRELGLGAAFKLGM